MSAERCNARRSARRRHVHQHQRFAAGTGLRSGRQEAVTADPARVTIFGMQRPYQFSLRQLFVATTLIAVWLALAADLFRRLLALEGNTFLFALEANAIAAMVLIVLEVAWLGRCGSS